MSATPSDLNTSTNSPKAQTDERFQRRWSALPFAGWKLLLALPLVLSPAIWWMSSSAEQTDVVETMQRLPVETMRLRSAASYSIGRTYSGELVAQRSSDLGFERGGTVVVLLADEGDVVSVGTPLARLDSRDLEAQRSQLEAQRRQVAAQLQELETGPRREDIAAAEAAVSDLNNQLALAELQAQRRESLFEQGAISAEERDEKRFGANAIADRLHQAQSQLEALRNGTRQEQISAQIAQVEQIDARIRAVDVSLDKSVLYAPFSGRVSQRMVDEGAVLGGSQPLMRLVESRAMEAKIGVPEQVAQRLTLGESRAVQVGASAYRAVGTAKLPEVDEDSQTVTVVLEMASDSDLTDELTIGATASLAVNEQQTASGYWVPSTALIAGERGLWSVYVLSLANDGEGYRVARRDVELLHSENSSENSTDTSTLRPTQSVTRSFVRGLVAEGDRIITSGTHRVVTGQLVVPSDASLSEENRREAVQ